MARRKPRLTRRLRSMWRRVPRALRLPAVVVPVALLAIALTVARSTGALSAVLGPLGLASDNNASPAPANDNVANASALGTQTAFSGTTAGATVESGEPDAAADDHTVWFAWTPPQSGVAYLVPTGAAPVPTVRAYSGADVAHLDRVDVSNAGDSQAAAAIPAFSGHRYLIQVDAAAADANVFSFTVFQPFAGAPENDNFASATSLAEAINDRIAGKGSGPVGSGTTAGATAETDEPGSPVHSVWYSWATPPSARSGNVTVAVAPTTPGANVHLSVYTGADLAHLTLVGPSSPAASATFDVNASTTYSVQVDGDEAYFDLSVTPTGVAPPDTTPPEVSCSPPSSWSTKNVVVNCTASDAGSGLADASDAKFTLQTTLAAGIASAHAATDSHRVCDRSGNCTTAGPYGDIQIDPVAPAISCDPAPAAWVAYNVTRHCTASDADSGLADQADASFTLTTSIADGSSSAHAALAAHAPVCDVAGNCTVVPSAEAQVDRAAPVVHCGSVPAGWQSTDPKIACTATDDGSGLANPKDASFDVATSVGDANVDNAAHTVAQQVCDAAGNCSTAGPFGPIQVDRRAPAITCTPPQGWQRGNSVTVPCTASDDGSGLAHAADASFDVTASIAAGSQGSATTTTHNVCDLAGNCATSPQLNVPLDDAAPKITCQSTPTAWQPGNLVVDCSASDAGSGVAASDATFTLQATVADGTASAHVALPARQVCDAAGNCASTPKLAAGRVDRQTPKVVCALPAAGVHYGEVDVTCTASDGNGSGLAFAGDAHFTLGTDVGAGNTDAHAMTNTRNVCDAAGNCTTAGPVGPIDVDRTSPPPGSAPHLDTPSAVHVLAARAAATFAPTGAGGGTIVVPYGVPGATSDAGLEVTTACQPVAGAAFSIGTTNVVCGARDTADRTTTDSFPLDVAAAPKLAPRGAASAGNTWRAVGTGYAPNDGVTIELDGRTIARSISTRSGTVSALFEIPETEPAGSHLLVVRGARADGSQQLVVTPLSIVAAISRPPIPTTTTTTVPRSQRTTTTTTEHHHGEGELGEGVPLPLAAVSSAAPAPIGATTPTIVASSGTGSAATGSTPGSAPVTSAPHSSSGHVTFGGGKRVAAGAALPKVNSGGGSSSSWGLVLLVGLLVALAAAVTVYMIRRRRMPSA